MLTAFSFLHICSWTPRIRDALRFHSSSVNRSTTTYVHLYQLPPAAETRNSNNRRPFTRDGIAFSASILLSDINICNTPFKLMLFES